MRRIMIRHAILAALPLVLGVGAGLVFAWQQRHCGGLVGPLFAAKCGRIQAQYQLWIQTVGTALGCLLAALIGIWLEWRRTRRGAVVSDRTEPAP